MSEDRTSKLHEAAGRLRKSHSRVILFTAMLLLSLAGAAYLAFIGAGQHVFEIGCSLAVACISAYVLKTGYTGNPL